MIIPWLQKIADGAPGYGDEWMREVYQLDGYQVATDGHVLAMVKSDDKTLTEATIANFPKPIAGWFFPPAESKIKASNLKQFCNPAVYARKCETCKGTCIKACDACSDCKPEYRKNCGECEGKLTEQCLHEGNTPFIHNYGFIGKTLFNRTILWKVVGNVDDSYIRFRLNGKADMIVLEGNDWKAAVMPIRQECCTQYELARYEKLQF